MLNGIQLARAIAAYAVVLYHLDSEIRFETGNMIVDFTVGKAGVDLFFVISGFIMVWVTKPGETALDFMAKRLFRIVPLYYFATFIAIGMVLVRPWLLQPARLEPDMIVSTFLFFPAFDSNMEARPLLFLGWTLNYEMMFYALFALALFLPPRWRVWGTVSALIGLILAAPYFSHEAAALFYSQPIMLEFAAGCLIGLFLKSETGARIVKAVPMWPVIALGFGLFFWAAFHTGAMERAIMYGIPACLVVFGFAGQDIHRTPLPSSPVTVLGDASYSLYLLHILVYTVLSLGWFKLLGTGLASQLGYIVIALSAVTLLSILSYYIVEKGSNAWLRRQWAKRRAAVAA